MKLVKCLVLLVIMLLAVTGCDVLGLDDDADDAAQTVADSTLFVLSSAGKYISAFNYVRGELIKENFVELKSESAAANFCVWEDKILVAATAYGALMVYDAKNGAKIREVNLGDGVKPAFVTAKNGTAFVTATQGAKKLHRVDLGDFSVISAAGGDCLQNAYFCDADGLLYVSDIEDLSNPAGKVLAFDPQSLSLVKSYQTTVKNPQAIIFDSDKILVACVGQSWGTAVSGAIEQISAAGVSSTEWSGKFPSVFVDYLGKIYANAGYGVAGLFNAQDVGQSLAAVNYCVAAADVKGEFLAATESNWSSDDGKAHLYLYKNGEKFASFQVGDSPSCVNFYKK